MKKQSIFVLLLSLGCILNVKGQILKKINKKIEQKIDKKIDEEIDDIFDGKKKKDVELEENEEEQSDTSQKEKTSEKFPKEIEQDSVKINTKFDFVPGDELLFFDDFSNDFVGDFPSKWNTNGSGEIVTVNDDVKWFEIKPGYSSFFIPDVTDFPEEYTIEYDVMTSGVASNITHLARFYINFSENNQFKKGTTKDPLFGFPYARKSTKIAIDNKNGIENDMNVDIKEIINSQAHISIAVNKQRLRFWVNDKKYIDIPRFFTEDFKTKYLKFNLKYFKEGRDRLFIKNLKIAKGGIDLRRQLINQGSYSTNNILFDSTR